MDDVGFIVTDETRQGAYDTDTVAIGNAGYVYYEMDTDIVEETGRDMMEDMGAIGSASLAKAENEVHVADEPIDLPIRPASEHTDRIPVNTPAAAGPFPPHRQVRRQKALSIRAVHSTHSNSRSCLARSIFKCRGIRQEAGGRQI
jgi:hypothetical protein